MTDEPKEPPFDYRVVSDADGHHVVLVRHETPDIWQRIATFGLKDRADSYAEIENMLAGDDFIDGEPPRLELAGPAPAPLAIPASRVSPDFLRPATPAERARVGAELLSDAAAGAGATVRIEAAPSGALPEPEAEIAPSGDPCAPAPISYPSVEDEKKDVAPKPAETGPKYSEPIPAAPATASTEPPWGAGPNGPTIDQIVARGPRYNGRPLGDGKAWRKDDIADLRVLAGAEIDPTTAGLLLGRSPSALAWKVKEAGWRVPAVWRPLLSAASPKTKTSDPPGRPSLAIGSVPVIEPPVLPSSKSAPVDPDAEAIAKFIAEHGVTRAIDWGADKVLVEACRELAYDLARQPKGRYSRGGWLLNNAALDRAETYRRVNLELERRGKPQIKMPKDGKAA